MNVVFIPSYCFTIVCVLVCQSCLTLCDSKDCNQPGVSLHGILQARILEQVAIPFSRHLPDPRMELKSSILQASFLPPELPGKILFYNYIYITYKIYLISSFLKKKLECSCVSFRYTQSESARHKHTSTLFYILFPK